MATIPPNTSIADNGAGNKPLLQAGDCFAGRYRIIAPLGKGGMGVVYLAKCDTTGKRLAIKVMPLRGGTSGEHLLRFEREARTLSRFEHPNIVRVFDVGIADNCAFFTMEYLDGKSLQEKLERRGHLEMRESLEIFSQIMSALEYAHSKGVVHRDIKPGNIMLERLPNGSSIVKLVDLGIARFFDTDGQSISCTATGQVLGSPLYMSPEQGVGRRVDGRSDIYSAGCVLYEMLSGRHLFQGENALLTVGMHLSASPEMALEELCGRVSSPLGVHPALLTMLTHCLAKDPAERFSSATAVILELPEVMPGIAGLRSIKDTEDQISSRPRVALRQTFAADETNKVKNSKVRQTGQKMPGASAGANRISPAEESANALRGLLGEAARPSRQRLLSETLNRYQWAVLLIFFLLLSFVSSCIVWMALHPAGSLSVKRQKYSAALPMDSDDISMELNHAFAPGSEGFRLVQGGETKEYQAFEAEALAKTKININAHYSHIETRDGERCRVFEFPDDVSLGFLEVGEHFYKAKGHVAFPADSYVTYRVSDAVLKKPALAALFQDGDFQALRLANNSGVTTAFLRNFKQMRSLTGLDISRASVGDDLFDWLDEMPAMQDLDLSGTRVTAEGLYRWKGFKNLHTLRLLSVKHGELILNYIGACRNLVALNLQNNVIEPHALSKLRGLDRLETLKLSCSRMKADDFAALACLPSLKTLVVDSCVMDRAIIPQLLQFPKLQSLGGYIERWTGDDMAAAKSIKPGLKIHLVELYDSRSAIQDGF